mmetsp:Transcript_27023/g.62281  ORF Transcript_27023/g.62281 Transcript_27023/m.62281 type:complete len:469 (+) Transcript_27023:22-1428(+)
MRIPATAPLLLLLLLPSQGWPLLSDAKSAQTKEAVAQVPPKGWNSWDTFQGAVNETTILETADKMCELLAPSGYDTVTIDEFWYPDASTAASIDEYGRVIVDVVKYPSAAGGVGFKPLADKLHAMGLKIGIHVMHGVPSAAQKATCHVEGTSVPVWDLTTGAKDLCNWNKEWYRLNMSHPAAQSYLDSIYGMYASWDIDFIKNDCVFGDNLDTLTLSNIQGARMAMDRAGRPMVYSLSPGFSMSVPGDAVFQGSKEVSSIVNMYRVTQDWHGWNSTDKEQGWPLHFKTANVTTSLRGQTSYNGTKSWPDLDMLNPFRDPESFRMQQTLWAMARSPLVYGGDMRLLDKDSDHVKIMTNAGVLRVTDMSVDNRQVWHQADTACWVAKAKPGSHEDGSFYVGLFRFQGEGAVRVSLDQLGIEAKKVLVTDLWTGQFIEQEGSVSSEVLAACDTTGAVSSRPCSAMLRVLPQ